MKRIIATLFLIQALVAHGAEKMNVVLILIDDLSHYGISAYGAEKIGSVQDFFDPVEFETPRIDSLADEGLKCDYAYAYPNCEPTRIALMSGKHNSRNYLRSRAQHYSDITFGDLFQQNDYATCLVGKWKQSRGTNATHAKDYIFEFGWDEFCAFDVIKAGYRMIDPDVVENGKVMNYKGVDPVTGRRYFGPDIFNRYALDFLERNQDKPFFLYYSMVLMHDEHTPTPDTQPARLYDEHDISKPTKWGHMKGDDRRYFPDMLKYTDKMVGQLLDKLKELNLEENTLVLLMGDNGTKECFTHILPDGSVFKGDKGANKEGGLHVPLLLRAPGTIPKGTVYSGLVNVTDILPTLCEAASIQAPNKKTWDGMSFWQQAIGEKGEDHRDYIYTWYSKHQADNPENLIEYVFTKKFKRYSPSLLYPDAKGRFFDLRTDPFETAGNEKKKVPKTWDKMHYSGLDVSQLTDEQLEAYEHLGEILKQHAYVPVEGLEIRKTEAPLRPGSQEQLTCRLVPDNATRNGVVWVSSDPRIASVDKFGVVTAHKKGEVEISVYSWDDANPMANNPKQDFLTTGISDSIAVSVE
ncbi:MAG: sulfatase-like hydrolase/transferase [Lentimonas sp.]